MRKFSSATFFLLFIFLSNDVLFSQSKKLTDHLQNHNLELFNQIYQLDYSPQQVLNLISSPVDAADDKYTTPVSGLGLDGNVYAVLANGDDIYLGGSFLYFDGEILLNRVAVGNGETFEPMGDGLNGDVSALVIYNGQLIAGGSFTKSGETALDNVARWTGESWVPLGEGMDGPIRDLIVYNGELIAAGSFLKSGMNEVNNIASWDGTEWNSLEGGMKSDTGSSVISSLEVYGDNLIAGGEFTQAGEILTNSIASWNGTSWMSLGDGFSRPDSGVQLVSSLTIYEGDLVISGLYMDLQSITTFFSDIMRWDGAEWSQIGAAIPGKLVHAMDVIEDQIITAGSNLGGNPGFNSYITIYDGTSWNPDLLPISEKLEAVENIQAMDVDAGRVIIGGEFSNTTDNIFNFTYLQNNVLLPQLDPIAQPVSLGSVRSIASYNDEIIIGGDFKYPDEQGMNLLKYTDPDWDTMNAGFAGRINEIITYDGYLVAAGEDSFFNEYGSIARWDGTTWESLGEGLSGVVEALVEFEGNLIAAGQGLISYNNSEFAVWDGQEWSPLFENPDDSPGFPRTMIVHNGELFAGGFFSNGVFSDSGHIARWNGEVFEPVGEGFNSLVLDLAVYNGELVASGGFIKSGEANVPNVARWDGENWHPFGEGFGISVQVLETFQGDLIAGGNFFQSGETITPGVARWNGEEWLPMGSGVRGAVWELHADGSSLHIGGSFRMAGNEAALNYTIWNEMVTSVKQENDTPPVAFSLQQNYPNPFNPSTIISFDLPRKSEVRLEVFNTLGQRVALLREGVMSSGTHSVMFDAESLASGIYLYRLNADGFSQTKRFTLIK